MSDTFNTATGPDANGAWGTINGQPITDGTITQLVADAEAGFPNAALNPVGRPRTVGTQRAETVTVRLDPDRLNAVRQRAHQEHTSASAIMRRALDNYLAS